MHEHRTEISLVTLFQQGFTTYSYIDFLLLLFPLFDRIGGEGGIAKFLWIYYR